MKTVARYETKDGRIPEPPAAAYSIIEDGRLCFNITADELDVMVNFYFEHTVLPAETLRDIVVQAVREKLNLPNPR